MTQIFIQVTRETIGCFEVHRVRICKHNTAKYWNYTSQWNLLDYPSVVFPVCKVEKDKDEWQCSSKPLSGTDEENHKLWNATDFDGVPVGLQLVGRRFEDEKILGILEDLEKRVHLPFKRGFHA